MAELRADDESWLVIKLTTLAEALTQTTCLNSFSLSAALRSRDSEDYLVWATNKIQLAISQMLASITSLKSLKRSELDVTGYLNRGGSAGATHLCPQIAQICSRARYSRVRLPSVCAELLQVREDTDRRHCAHNITINVSHPRHPSTNPGISAMTIARRCVTPGWSAPSIDHIVLVNAARTIIPQLPDLEHLRITWHEVPSLETYAKECVTGRKARIEGRDWDEWGEDSEHEDDETVSEDDDLFRDDEMSSGDV